MNLFKNVHESWIPLLHSLAYKEPLLDFLTNLSEVSFQPEYEKIFKVFEMPVKDIKLVVLGKDPYPLPGLATGVAYAVKEEEEVPIILRNIKKEVLQSKELVSAEADWQTLQHWTNQGVFLLNTALTVETGNAGSHMAQWKEFTETVIKFISRENPCLWMLWGQHALSYRTIIKNPLIVKGYDRETIEEIPIDSTINYIIPGNPPITREFEDKKFSEDGFYLVNRILENKSFKQIIW